MAKGNQVNSFVIFQQLEDIAQFMDGDLDFKVANTITEVFNEDEKLMRDCDDEFIERMWKLGCRKRARRFVLFIDTLLYVNGAPLKYNQDRISKIISRNSQPELFEVDFRSGDPIDPSGPIQYHVGLIKMASSLCAGRHRDSIDFFLGETPMSYKLVLQRMVSKDIVPEVRIVYTQLMKTLFVDREPMELNQPVQTSRIMPPLQGSAQELEARLGVPSPKAVDPYAEMGGRVERPTAGFTDLKQAIFSCFDAVAQVTAKDVRENDYLCEMIALAHQLLLFGLYDGGVEVGKHHDGVLTLGAEAKRLGNGLLNMIDGRKDVLTGLEDMDSDTRFRIDLLETNTIMSLKKCILALIMDLFGLRSSTKIRILLRAVVDNLAKGGGSPKASPMTFDIEDGGTYFFAPSSFSLSEGLTPTRFFCK